MAADVSTVPGVNGYAPHQGYGGLEQQQQPHHAHAYGANPAPPAATGTPSTSASSQQGEISKDEVGWYFVEQYYTTLSRSPEKLYLFYNKRSQFVSGQEADKVAVCVGLRAINDRIKELDFHDCKVRVTNVDSQASDSNIVIQVIGEMSNKSQPHRKFTQTFVLATQTNGYFVLNDIFRYLIEEEDEPEAQAEVPAPQEQQQQQQAEAEEEREAEEVQPVPASESGYQEPAPTAEETEPKTLTSSSDLTAVERDAKEVDKELEQKLLKGVPAEAPAAGTNGVAKQPAQAEEAAPSATAVSQPEPSAQSTASTTEADLEPEKPKDPSPTPATAPVQQAPSQPAAPPKPKTWANLAAAANRVATPATPAVPAPAAATQQRPAQPAAKPTTPTPTASTPQTTSTAPAAPSVPREATSSPAQDEWNTVGGSHNRQQSRQVNHQPQEQGPQHRGYIKNVHENVSSDELRNELAQYGELLHFDIARLKNCAFVDFKTAEGFQNAVNKNPHKVGDSELNVERRIRTGSSGFVQRGGFQGGRGGRGGAQGAPRGNYQGSGRGGYVPRGGRGGAPTSRTRAPDA